MGGRVVEGDVGGGDLGGRKEGELEGDGGADKTGDKALLGSILLWCVCVEGGGRGM